MDTLTPDTLATSLQESKKALLAKVLRTLGHERCQAIFAETLTIESNGGMLTSAGDRRRTPGGTFFHLVRQQCSKEERTGSFPTRQRRSHRSSPSPHSLTRLLSPSPSTNGRDLPLCM